ncbi:MAG: hypothetical protein P1Q69_03930 [Candidatus Thorarchaeota archaeon]|nr:hypothetical protein [Candidatus Thorarchaeota archaeon]
MSYITRVSIWFNSEGASPGTVIKKLLEMGFTLVRGAYDFVYTHEVDEEMSDADLSNSILEIGNALHETLSGFSVLYALSTHPKDENGDYVRLEVLDAELEEIEKEIEELEEEESTK